MLKFSGKRLREVRTALGLSQEKVATRLNTRTTNISKWENDRSAPNGVHMVLLLRILRCELEEVTTDEPTQQRL